jgi:hypothetical protein
MSLDRRSFRKGTGVATAAARSDDELASHSVANVGAGLVDAVAAVELTRDFGGRRPVPADPDYTTAHHPGWGSATAGGTGRTVEE